MLPKKCIEKKCPRYLLGKDSKGEALDCCAVEKTKRGIGVVPCFQVSEKECRVLRTAYMAAAAAKERPMRVSSGIGPYDKTVVETPRFEVHHDDTDTIPTRE